MEYIISIGLEVHAELATATKLFCGCENKYGGQPNSRCCPVCAGMPGTLPVLNKKAAELAVAAGFAMNCHINEKISFDRKHYFYPDLPKAYQITQYETPICENGHLGGVKISRIQLEEDTGKLTHSGGQTLIDYNRSGVPLIEIVTSPDITGAEQAAVFLEELKGILEYTEASYCLMEQGQLRCDVNISVRPEGQTALGNRVEMKNINSFKAVCRAIEYEQARQTAELEKGNVIAEQTRRWDDAEGISVLLRDKEQAQYRFFPEPDLPPLVLDPLRISEIKASLPELPASRVKRYITEFALTQYDAGQITKDKIIAEFFEAVVSKGVSPKAAVNLIMGDISRILNEKNSRTIPFAASGLAELITLIENNTVSVTASKKVIELMFEKSLSPSIIVKEADLGQISDRETLYEYALKAVRQNPGSADDYKKGKKNAAGYIMGQAMKLTGGRANPDIMKKIIFEVLEKSNL